MGKYLESFRKHLKNALDTGVITKAELHRKTGISLSMLYRYLDSAEPGLHTLELIAEAIQCDPRELIKLENDPIFRPHTLQDCLEAVNQAVTQSEPQSKFRTAKQDISSSLVPPHIIELLSQSTPHERKVLFEMFKDQIEAILELRQQRDDKDKSETG